MKSIKNRKMKGSVLLTVVSVMALLIIFLFGTLVLATAANNRAHVNYSTAQTNITARTVVNTAYNAIAKNKDYADAITALSSTNTSLDIPVTISSSGTNVNTLGHLDSLTAEYAGTRKFYNANQKKWQDCDLIKITAEATMNGITTTSNAYIVKDPPSPPPGGGGGGAGFVTTGGAGFTCKTNLFGGSYINLPKLATAETYDYLTGYSTYSGNYLSGETFTFDNSGSLIEADTVINGNLEVKHLTSMRFPGKGLGITVWGDMNYVDNSYDQLKYIGSNLTNTSAGDIEFNKMPYLYIDGTLRGSVRFGPYIDGGTSQFPFNTFAGNLDVNNGKFAMGGDLYLMNADKDNLLYPKDDAVLYSWVSSVINKSGDSAVAKAQGDIYSKGNFRVSGQKTIKLQNLYVEKDLIIDNLEGKLEITGDLVVKGDITGSFRNSGKLVVHGDVYAHSSSVDIKNASDTTIDDDDIDEYTGTVYPSYAERAVVLGEDQIRDASNNLIPVEQTKVVKKMDEVLKNVINPYNSDDMPASMQTKRAQLLANNDKRVSSEAEAITKLGTGFTKCTGWWNSSTKKVELKYDDTATMGNYWPVIRESCVLSGDIKNNNPEGIDGMKRSLIFDPGAGEMLVVLDGYDDEMCFLVNDSQGGTVYFYLQPNTKTNIQWAMYTTKYLQLFKNLKDGDADGDSSNGAQTSIQFFTDSTYAMSGPVSFTDDSLGLSIPSTALKYSPGAKIYGGTNSELKIRNFNTVTAQIISPNVKFTAAATDDQVNFVKGQDIYYNGYKVNTNDNRTIFGCLNTQSSSFENQANMIYVPDLSTGGTPIHLPDSTHWYKMLYYDEY